MSLFQLNLLKVILDSMFFEQRRIHLVAFVAVLRVELCRNEY